MIDLGVPEKSLVSITPEILGGSDVLEFILRRKLIIRRSGMSCSMLMMSGFQNVGGNAGSNQSRDTHNDTDLLPQGSSVLSMSLGVEVLSLKLLGGSLIRMKQSGELVAADSGIGSNASSCSSCDHRSVNG